VALKLASRALNAGPTTVLAGSECVGGWDVGGQMLVIWRLTKSRSALVSESESGSLDSLKRRTVLWGFAPEERFSDSIPAKRVIWVHGLPDARISRLAIQTGLGIKFFCGYEKLHEGRHRFGGGRRQGGNP
jgi:hypothetical protein